MSYVFEKRWVAVRKTAKDRIAKCEKDGLCVACMEKIAEGERSMRGMHMRCYFATARAIRTGKTTEEERMREGKMLEAQSGGRKPANPVTLDLAE